MFLFIMADFSGADIFAGEVHFYVSPAGDDSWSGSVVDKPFATIQRARDAIRELKSQSPLEKPVTVYIGGGIYDLTEVLVLGPEDSGTESCPVVYKAVVGEEPIVKGESPLAQLMVFRGDPENENYVEYITVCGITFSGNGTLMSNDRQDIGTKSHITSLIDLKYVRGCVFKGNTIRNTSISAFQMTGEENEITGNSIFDVVDGAIRVQGDHLIIHNNVIRDIHYTDEWERPGWGICLEGETSNTTIESNTIVRAGICLCLLDHNINITIENNILVNPELSMINLSNREGFRNEDIQISRNIFYYRYNDVDLYCIRGGDSFPGMSDNNIFWNPTGCIRTSKVIRGIQGVSLFSEWYALGFDANSLIQNPLFVDQENDDYRIREDSPAFAIGFESIGKKKDLFRRFCFAMEKDRAESFEFPEFLLAGAFQNDSILFIIIDVDAGMDLAALKQYIEKYCSEDDLEIPSLFKKIIAGDILPLERIYELEQEKDYSPEEGQLKESSGRVISRSVLSMELYPDQASIDKYREIHGLGQAWPEITANMLASGILDIDIYIKGTLTFMIMDRDKDWNSEKSSSYRKDMAREKEWQDYVSQFQKTDPATGKKWLPMNEQ